MKIFVTGGTGFIGTHFLLSKHSVAHQVVALRRPGSVCCQQLTNEPVWIEKGMDAVRAEDLSGCDALVHFASVGVSPKKATWDEMFHWNVTSTLRLAQSAKAAGVKRIVVAGSFAEYGASADRYDPIPPNAPLEPTFGYAASKAAAFAALHGYAVESGIQLAYYRIFSAYGLGQYEGNFWPSMRKAALSGADFEMTMGQQVRDYIPVELVAERFWSAVLAPFEGAPLVEVKNIGSGVPVSMQEFARHWWSAWHAKGVLKIGAIPYRPNEVMRFVPKI